MSVLLFDREGPLVTLTLNRPDRLNAVNVELHEALAKAWDDIEGDDSIRAVLLTGSGRGFCPGQDLSDRDPESGEIPDLGHTLDTYYNPLIRRMRAWTKPKIAAVNGVAAGAGVSIALACDIVLAAESAKFLMAFANIGLAPDAGATWHYPRLMGEARAKAAMLLAEKIPAQQAADWGLIYRAVSDDSLMETARGLALKLASGPSLGLSHTIANINASWSHTLDQQLDRERDSQRTLGQSADYAEGVSAFLNKRPASFKGQ